MKKVLAAGAFVSTLFISSAALAECTTEVKKDDLTDAQVQALYDCIKSELREGYAAGGGEHTREYTSWGAAATLPAAPGVHGKRFLMTFVNDIGFEEYVKFSDERGPMPVGSVIQRSPWAQAHQSSLVVLRCSTIRNRSAWAPGTMRSARRFSRSSMDSARTKAIVVLISRSPVDFSWASNFSSAGISSEGASEKRLGNSPPKALRRSAR